MPHYKVCAKTFDVICDSIRNINFRKRVTLWTPHSHTHPSSKGKQAFLNTQDIQQDNEVSKNAEWQQKIMIWHLIKESGFNLHSEVSFKYNIFLTLSFGHN